MRRARCAAWSSTVCARLTRKRGDGLDITSLDDHADDELAQPEPLEDIGDALDELARLEPELAGVVELKVHCGFTLADVARIGTGLGGIVMGHFADRVPT